MSAPRLRETAEDYPHVVANLSERWRVILCPQAIQWIVQQRDPGAARWRNVSYFRTRNWLCLFCGPICSDASAWRALASLPETVSGRRRTRPQPREGSAGSQIPEKANAALARRRGSRFMGVRP